MKTASPLSPLTGEGDGGPGSRPGGIGNHRGAGAAVEIKGGSAHVRSGRLKSSSGRPTAGGLCRPPFARPVHIPLFSSPPLLPPPLGARGLITTQIIFSTGLTGIRRVPGTPSAPGGSPPYLWSPRHSAAPPLRGSFPAGRWVRWMEGGRERRKKKRVPSRSLSRTGATDSSRLRQASGNGEDPVRYRREVSAPVLRLSLKGS